MPDPIKLSPSPNRKVTIEHLHDERGYFVRVTAEGKEIKGGRWSQEYVGDGVPDAYLNAASAAFEQAWMEDYPAPDPPRLA